MKQRRMTILVAIMLALVVARVGWSVSQPAAQVVEAASRPLPAPSAISQEVAPSPGLSPLSIAADATGTGEKPAGNPFAARHPPQPVAPPVQAAPVVAPVEAPPDPGPAYQVIGSYDDDSNAPGVFIATPHGVEVARLGSVLDAEYKVTALTRQSVTIQQLASKREFTLGMPAGATP